eukprot:7134136-Prymnesium_polylepis.2
MPRRCGCSCRRVRRSGAPGRTRRSSRASTDDRDISRPVAPVRFRTMMAFIVKCVSDMCVQ